MWWLTPIIDLVRLAIPNIGGWTKTVAGDQAARDATAAQENVATKEEFGKEFSYPVGAARTWFDVLMDGVNRVPRPAMALGLIGIFVWTCADPPSASRAFVALALIPDALWTVFYMVVGFYFTSRLLEKVDFKTYKVDKATLEMARKQAVDRRIEVAGRLESRGNQVVDADQNAVTRVAELPFGRVAMPAERQQGGDLMDLAGFGPGRLTTSGYTGQLPPARAAGWRNPVATYWARARELNHA